MVNTKIPKRITTALINSLSVGVVPRIGLEYVAVGRKNEIQSILTDLNNISEGGGAFRLITGRYGSGKSFLMQIIRNNAMERGYVVADCDLSPERRFSGTKGQGLATYRELMKNLSTKTIPDGGALDIILQKWIFNIQTQIVSQDGISPESSEFNKAMEAKVYSVINAMETLVHGYDFATIILNYWKSIRDLDDNLKQNAVRWLRGEFSTKMEARKVMNVATIIDDENWYDYIKLMAGFVHQIGYKGLIIFFDEAVNLYKIPNSISRQNNYERLLSMFNDVMQGKTSYLGFYIGATNQLVEDERRGLYSYDALRSRLVENRFSTDEHQDNSSTVLRLATLSHEELFVLLGRLQTIHSMHFNYEPKLTDTQMASFLNLILSKMGSDCLLTPRDITRDFLGILNILQQNPDVSFEELSNKGISANPTKETDEVDEYAEFDL